MGLFSGFEHIIREREPLAPYTWFRLGGVAENLAEPTSAEELEELVKRCGEQDVPVRMLGGGSNLLVRDQGVPGLVIHLGAAAFSEITVADNVITAGAGAKLGHVIDAVREGLAGLEPLVGIPGTIGGTCTAMPVQRTTTWDGGLRQRKSWRKAAKCSCIVATICNSPTITAASTNW